MTRDRVSKEMVERVVSTLNSNAKRLGWERRYGFIAGSNVNGVQHVLETRVPGSAEGVWRASTQPIGHTLAAARLYLEAMLQAMNDALAERERERMLVKGGAISLMEAVHRPDHSIQGTFADPDARSTRRRQEQV